MSEDKPAIFSIALAALDGGHVILTNSPKRTLFLHRGARWKQRAGNALLGNESFWNSVNDRCLTHTSTVPRMTFPRMTFPRQVIE